MKTSAGLAAAAACLLAVPLSPSDAAARHNGGSPGGLPLGTADLRETRTTTAVQPGVTLTRIVRGDDEPTLAWTVEVAIPGGSGSPDPDAPPAAIRDEQSARELTAELRDGGFDARAERVVTPRMTDFAGGTLGWRVRVGRFAQQAGAATEQARLRAAGYAASATYTGWDGEPGVSGVWRLDMLRIDPKRFTGSLDASYGPDLENRERTSDLANARGASAAVNAGFFVLDPRAGAPGDPAGVGVYDGRLLSETVARRPALLLREDARHGRVVRASWEGEVRNDGGRDLALDGINRVPGLIRNCGGTRDDLPTWLPLHDVTCTDADELLAFTPAYGPATPTGPGVEAVLDARGTVVQLRSPRGGPLPRGGASVQATGNAVEDLRTLATLGEHLQLKTTLVDEEGHRLATPANTDVVNGGPELVRDRRIHTTPATDGMVHPGNPSFYYGWVHKRNPRTFAGVDSAGRVVLVTADGRSTRSLGLSIRETAAVAKALGLRDAVNLDGGGSTTMVIDGQVVNAPSDATGERPVGDALLVMPGPGS